MLLSNKNVQFITVPMVEELLRGVEWVVGLFLFPLVLGKNVIATWKIWYFLCSLDNLLQKIVMFFFFWKSNLKMALSWKKGYFWPTFFTFFSHFDFWLFLPYQFWKNTNLLRWFLFGMIPGPYFIKVKIIVSHRFKINRIFYLIKEFMKNSCVNFFYLWNKICIKVKRNSKFKEFAKT